MCLESLPALEERLNPEVEQIKFWTIRVWISQTLCRTIHKPGTRLVASFAFPKIGKEFSNLYVINNIIWRFL
jgi:hypothetical protein